MTNLIKQIIKIIGDNKLSINFWGNEIWLNIYDTEISITINTKKKYVYLNCEVCDNHITADEINELHQIMRVLEENIDEVISCIE